MEWLLQLQNAVNYMEKHLLEKINYENAAKSVFMSSYNFHRTFSLMAGITANEYIRNRRLSLAAQELQETDISVIDAAFKYGYETPESFSKAFSRFHGVTPKQAKSKGTPLRMFNPLVIKIIMEGGVVLDYRITKKEKQSFIAVTRAFPNEIINDEGDHSISDFCGECYEKKLIEPLRQLRPDGKRDLYGLCNPLRDYEDSFEYGIGVIIDDETDISKKAELIENGYAIWETESTEYVVLKCMGGDGDSISEMWSRFYKEFLPQTNYKQTELTDFEIYFEKGEEGVFCELWIPIETAAK